MIWYLDTETVQLTTHNIDKICESQYTRYINERLEKSKEWVMKQRRETEKDGIARNLLVVNVLNTGINEFGEELCCRNINQFLKLIGRITRKGHSRTSLCYFHNMKFDMSNILDYLYFTEADFKNQSNLIVGTKWYNYKLFYAGVLFDVRDSYNLTMLKLSEFGKAFGLPKELTKSSFEFDFDNIDIINRMLIGDKELTEYAMKDVRCLKAGVEAFKQFAKSDKMTIASTAFANWQATDHTPLAELTLQEQIDANYTYTGAICYPNPMYTEKIIEGEMVYIDNNGLYSASMYSEKAGFRHPYPVGMGVRKEGIPDFWNIDKYYTIRVRIWATVKPSTTIPFFRLGKQEHLGCNLQRKYPPGHPEYDPKNPNKRWYYKQSEYLKVVNEVCYINSIDLRLLHKYYDVHELEFDYYWEYETEVGLFDEYIDYWIGQKTIGTKTGNKPLRTVSKFMNNSLSGKFGQFIEDIVTRYEFDDENYILKHFADEGEKPPQFIFMPIVSAILAYSREIFLDMTESYPKEHYFYGDTDSNILTKEAFFKYLDRKKFSKTALGLWDIEYRLVKLKVLRPKTYMFTTKRGKLHEKYDIDDNLIERWRSENELVCKCAGGTDRVKEKLNYDNFEIGGELEGVTQLKPKVIPGGIALVPQPFRIKQQFRG